MNIATMKQLALTQYQAIKADPRAAFLAIRYQLAAAIIATVILMSNTASFAAGALQTEGETVTRPTLALDVNEMLYWMFEGANIIIVALGAVVFLTIGFVLGRKILEILSNVVD